MILNQKTYEILRWVVVIVIPASITLYGVIGNTCHIPYTDVVLTIAGAVDVFLGAIFGISKLSYDYQKRDFTLEGMGESEDE